MNLFQKICFGFAAFFLAIGLFFQGLSMYALSPYYYLRSLGVEPGIDFDKVPWLWPTWIGALVLITVATILCLVFRKKEIPSLVTSIGAGVGGVLSLVVGLTIKNALPVVVGMKYDQGIDSWQFIYCYLTTVAAALLIAIVAGVSYFYLREDRQRLENLQYTEQYTTLTGAEPSETKRR